MELPCQESLCAGGSWGNVKLISGLQGFPFRLNRVLIRPRSATVYVTRAQAGSSAQEFVGVRSSSWQAHINPLLGMPALAWAHGSPAVCTCSTAATEGLSTECFELALG